MAEDIDPEDKIGPQPPEVPEVLDVVPSQEMFDREVIANNLRAARTELANQKLRYYAAKAGLPDTGGHLEQHRKEVAKIRRTVEVFETLATEGLPIPAGVLEGGQVIHLPETIVTPVPDASA